MEDSVSMYVRASSDDVSLALMNADKLFEGVTRLVRRNADTREFAFVTKKMPEKDIHANLKALSKLGVDVLNTIRLGDF